MCQNRTKYCDRSQYADRIVDKQQCTTCGGFAVVRHTRIVIRVLVYMRVDFGAQLDSEPD